VHKDAQTQNRCHFPDNQQKTATYQKLASFRKKTPCIRGLRQHTFRTTPQRGDTPTTKRHTNHGMV
jgi:hypothetical protein